MVYRSWTGSRSGFLLAEMAVLLSILTMGLYFVMPAFWDFQERFELELATREITSAIREVKELSQTDAGDTQFFCNMENGLVTYRSYRGPTALPVQGTLSSSIACSDYLNVRFRKDGFAGDSNQYTFQLFTKDRKYRRQIVVAMYTGRVKVVAIQ